MTSVVRAGFAVAALLAAACAHAPAFDRSLRAGRWQDAAAQFRADSALQRSASAARLAARIHADPDSATWDPDQALELFARARRLAPKVPVPESDTRLESVLEYVVRERAARATQVIALHDSLRAAGADAERLRNELSELRMTNTTHDSERAMLQQLASRLEADLRDREAQMSLLRTELERLKEIDLARSSRPRRKGAPRTR